MINSITNPIFSHLHTFTKPTCYAVTKPTNSISQNTHQAQKFLPLWTVTEIAQAVNGRIVKWGPPGTISTDTRTLQPHQWFFAICGENFDAHDFITPDLSHKGCVGVIGKRVCENWDKGFVEIKGDTILSLMMMASYARDRFSGELIGVTGSVGKTTTKAMIALALGGIANMVYEMGMIRKGEILELARMARPSVRVVLNVRASHLANFASLEDLAMAKGEILVEAKPGDVCVMNADDPLVLSLPVPRGVNRVLFGRRMGCDVRLVAAESADGGHALRVVLEKDEEMVELLIPIPGLHLAHNACAAAAAATHLGVPLKQVATSLSTFSPVCMRSELIVARNGIKIVNDVYNANPISTKAAIDLLNSMECKGKRVAILGDMPVVSHDAESIAVKILKQIGCGDVVLVKGSRRMEMEKVVNTLKEMEIQN
ncbi:UDP-N-acetylmuramoyl-tripeptide--D-alanyl-D-alanine ligase [Morus notabilis]|uniref:UDP-N-acetylmuramoyl-tripeptide--D-alanyl-D-alanine ligase n=1 Tax=Morus notabilis TaxID=981085 RepID=W9RUG7_9ROSA|nr:UDP-N-acetylmuramoyl-tripeptide--D-alanyl-D-alanine ligase [Morus notabilis]